MANNCVSCRNCGHQGWSKPKGSIWITLVLAFFFLIPAIIYEIWRRSGLGVCENCGSDQIKPSQACATSKPSSASDLLVLFAIGCVGCVVVVFAYGLIYSLTNPNASESYKWTHEYEGECMVGGVEYYQSIKQHPVTDKGELVLDLVQEQCKNSKDGKYKAP